MNDAKRKTILLVEDEAIVAMHEKAILERNGYDVIIEYTGEKAVAAAESTPGIDLILMDIDLGRGIDGTEAARRILGTRELPLVFLSSHIEPEVVEKTEGITSYGYIVKDSGETVLATSIKMAFRLFEARMNEKMKTAELRKSEEKYRTLVENTNDVVYAMDLDGRFTYLSPGLGRMSGYTADELVGRRFEDLVYPDDLPGLRKGFWEIAAGGIEPHEFRVVDRNGSVRYVRTSSRAVTVGGAVTGITGVMSDITDHMKAEEALRESEDKFRSLYELLPAVALIHVAGTVELVNPQCVTMFRGGKVGDFIGVNIIDFFAEKDRPVLMEHMRGRASRLPGAVDHYFATLRRLDGEEFPAEIFASDMPLRGKLATQALVYDISARRRAEEALQLSEEQSRLIFDNTSLGIFLSSPDGKYRKVNRAVLRISGYDSIEEFIRVPTQQLYADRAEQERIMNDLRTKGSVENVEMRAIKKDGTVHWISMSAVMLKDENGVPLNIVGFVEDITDRRRTGDLIQAERDLGLLLAGAASLKDAMRFGLSAAISAGDMDSGGVYLINEQGGIDLFVHEGLSEEFLGKVRHYGADTNSVRIALRGVPVFLDDSGVVNGLEKGSVPESFMSIFKNEGLKTLAVLPIMIRGEVVACMNISSRVHMSVSPHKRMALESIASRLGSAILRMKAQEALRERESRLRSYFDMPLVGLAITSPDKGWLEVNDRVCEMLGYSADELEKLTWAELTHPDDLEVDVSLFNRVLSGEIDSYTMEKRFIRKDGGTVWTSLGVGCVRKPDRSVNYIVAMLDDITDRKRAEERLKFSEEKFHRSFTESPAALCIARLKDVRIIDVNDTFLRVSGFTRDEVINKSVAELLVWERPEDRDEVLTALTAGGSIRGKEYAFHIKDGSVLIGEYTAFIINIGGEDHILITIIDITGRKLAEEKIQALLAEKELLIREVHHRIKNNMNTITSLLTLQSTRPESRDAAAALQDAISRVRSMSVLYDKLYQSGNVRDMPVASYFPPLVAEIVSLFPGSSSVTVETKLGDFVLGAKALLPLGIIVNELVTNAMKYAFPGGKKGTICVSAYRKGKTVTLAVEDGGIGLPPGFDIAKSTGFGLELVTILARQLGGTIRVEKARGARFVLEFGAEE